MITRAIRPILFLLFALPALAQQRVGIFNASANIGSVIPPGTARFDPATQTYTLSATGNNMWLHQRLLLFLYRKRFGDLQFTADIAYPIVGGHPIQIVGAPMIRPALLALSFLPIAVAAQTTRPAITSVSHLSVYSSDFAKAEHFYVHDLGAVKRPDPQNPAGVRFYFNPIQFVEVLPVPADAPPKLRFDHAAYNTASAERMRLYLSEHRIQVPAAITKASDGSQFFNVRDPEGNTVQFIQPPSHPEAIPTNPLSSHIIHVGYIVHDQAREDAFYLGILGFRPYWHGGPAEDATSWVSIQVPDGHDWLEYMLVKGPENTGIPPSMSQETAGVLDHFSLGVPNIEKATNLLYAGDRLTARHSDPKIGRDGKWQLNIYDPDGIRAEIMEFQPSVKPCCSPFLAPSPIK